MKLFNQTLFLMLAVPSIGVCMDGGGRWTSGSADSSDVNVSQFSLSLSESRTRDKLAAQKSEFNAAANTLAAKLAQQAISQFEIMEAVINNGTTSKIGICPTLAQAESAARNLLRVAVEKRSTAKIAEANALVGRIEKTQEHCRN